MNPILALATKHDLEVHQMDVKSAYLNGELKENIYMEAPPGLDIPEGIVLKLLKAVYGTKQGGHIWYESISAKLRAMGYQCTEADHAMFVCTNNSTISIIALYMDDLNAINRDKAALSQAYQMTDLGEMSWILGMHVTHDHTMGWIALSQERLIKDVLEHFGKSNIHPISTPSLPNQHLIKLSSPKSDIKAYQHTIGALMYPMLSTCPDLAFTVATLGCHATSPRAKHVHTLNHMFHYLQAMSNHKLVFQ
jgi:hypothetical protein